MTLVKICGITNFEDALTSVKAGAEMLGFNFYPGSKRYIEPEAARDIIERLPPSVTTVGVFVNEASPAEVERLADLSNVRAVQLHGDEDAQYCRALKRRYVIKALRTGSGFLVSEAGHYNVDAVMIDAFHHSARGGTGHQADWSIAAALTKTVTRLFLAGGLTPDNVSKAIQIVRPYAVDACSGLELSPGIKDPLLVADFVKQVRQASPA
jgi:phosphoribosylanthranilate isomerase